MRGPVAYDRRPMRRFLMVLLAAAAPLLLAMECGGLTPQHPVEPPSGGYSVAYQSAHERVVQNTEEAVAQLLRSGVRSPEIARARALTEEAAGQMHRLETLVEESHLALVREVAEGYDECVRRLRDPGRYRTDDTARMLERLLLRMRNELAPGRVPIALHRRMEPPPPPPAPEVTLPPQPPAQPGSPVNAPAQVFYLAWRQAHGELVRAVQDGRDPRDWYGWASDMLRRWRESLGAGQDAEREALASYARAYGDLWDRTLGFQRYDTELSRDDVVQELERIRSALELRSPIR
jgi:hypothetical protein